MTEQDKHGPTFVYAIYIRARPEAIWQALTDADFTAKFWSGRRCETDWQQGSALTMRAPDGSVDFAGEVLESDPARRLVYTFDVRGSDEPASRVTYELEPIGGTVRLTVTHDRFPPDSAVHRGVAKGWPGILSGLKSLLETGQSLELHPQGGG